MVVEKIDRKLLVRLSGYIGESAELFDLDLRDVETIEINMKEVNYINSVGVKHWVEWSRKLPAHLHLTISEAPRLIVNQISMVMDFLPRQGVVQSLYVPYNCEECGKEENKLFTLGTEYHYSQEGLESKVVWPENRCERENCELEPDVIEMKYFAFLRQKAK